MQQVKFKDIAHLYFGVDAAINYDPKGTAGMLIDKIIGVSNYGLSVSNGYLIKPEEAKPLLRKLDNMNRKELIETLRIFEPTMKLEKDRIDGALKSVHEEGIKAMQGNEDYDMSKYALLIKHLLSKHFDLFSLIENGEAIDISTVTPSTR